MQLPLDEVCLISRNRGIVFEGQPREWKVFVAKAQNVKLRQNVRHSCVVASDKHFRYRAHYLASRTINSPPAKLPTFNQAWQFWLGSCPAVANLRTPYASSAGHPANLVD